MGEEELRRNKDDARGFVLPENVEIFDFIIRHPNFPQFLSLLSKDHSLQFLTFCSLLAFASKNFHCFVF